MELFAQFYQDIEYALSALYDRMIRAAARRRNSISDRARQTKKRSGSRAEAFANSRADIEEEEFLHWWIVVLIRVFCL